MPFPRLTIPLSAHSGETETCNWALSLARKDLARTIPPSECRVATPKFPPRYVVTGRARQPGQLLPDNTCWTSRAQRALVRAGQASQAAQIQADPAAFSSSSRLRSGYAPRDSEVLLRWVLENPTKDEPSDSEYRGLLKATGLERTPCRARIRVYQLTYLAPTVAYVLDCFRPIMQASAQEEWDDVFLMKGSRKQVLRAQPTFTSLHESVLSSVASALGLAAKLSLQCSTRELFLLFSSSPCFWNSIRLEGQVEAALLMHCLRTAKGGVKELVCAEGDSSPEAVLHESVARFQSGLRYCDAPPFTLGRRAAGLAALIPNVQELCLDESTCCLGGMTDDFARAVAARCPHLTRLEVRFAKGPACARLAAERFSDDGLIALAERCTNLKALVLCHCSGITDRALYALAANCHGLTELRLQGYSEQCSDAGLVLLLSAAAPTLEVCHLSSKLTRVTDATALALLRPWDQQQPGTGATQQAVVRQPGGVQGGQPYTHGELGAGAGGVAAGAPCLRSLKLGRNVTDRVLFALAGRDPTAAPADTMSSMQGQLAATSHTGLLPVQAQHSPPAPQLQHLHVATCRHMTAGPLLDLLLSGACPQLTRVRVSSVLAHELAALMGVSLAAGAAPHGVVVRLEALQGRGHAAVGAREAGDVMVHVSARSTA